MPTTRTWTGAVDANWNNPANWSPAGVPGVGDTAIIPAAPLNAPSVANGSSVTVSGPIQNNSTITVGAAANLTDFIINGAVTLLGTGSLTLSDSANNRIYSNQSGTLLTNQETIRGSGQIFGGSLGIVNALSGVINATGTNAALSISSLTLTNKGLVEATGAAGLALASVTLDQTGGGVLEANGGAVSIGSNVNILGGTLKDGASGGHIHSTSSSSLLDGTVAAVTIAPGTTLQIDNGANIALATNGTKGQIVNKGAIQINSTGNLTDLIVGSGAAGGTVALSGGGIVQLSDSNTNRIYSNTGSTKLDIINNTIKGAGEIFANSGLSVLNEVAGVINGSSSTAGNYLRIHDIGLTNRGLVEGTGTGGLEIDNITLNQAAVGVLEANGGTVKIGANNTIVGGTLKTLGAGTFHVTGANSLLDGTTSAVTIASGTTIGVDNSQNLALASNGTAGSLVNKGVVQLNSSGNYTDLLIGLGAVGGTVTLTGGGAIQMSDQNQNRIYGAIGSTTLDNIDNTIAGAGYIFSNGDLSLTNETGGVINGTSSTAGNSLSISSIVLTNKGLVEATGAGGLQLSGMTLNQSGGGVLEANGGAVAIGASVSLIGGSLKTVGTGTFAITGSSSVLDGTTSAVTIGAGTTLQVQNAQNLYLASNATVGSLVNNGEIFLNSSTNYTDLLIGSGAAGGTVALSGGGTILLSDQNENRIFSNTGSTTLDNIDNTIQGAGSIFSNGNLSLTNEASGVINGTSSTAGNSLSLNSIGVTNKGLIEATGSGGLSLSSMTLDQASGVLEANGGAVTIGPSVNLRGGSLNTVGAGTFTVTGGSSVLDGTASALTIGTGTTLHIQNALSFVLASNGTTNSIVNKGEILLNATVNYTDLNIGSGAAGGTVALSGGGTLRLSDSATNRIFGASGSTTLDNIDNTIQGAGEIFANGDLKIVNEKGGSFIATDDDHALSIHDIDFKNMGTVGVSNGGILTFVNALDNAALGVLTGGTYVVGDHPGTQSWIAIFGTGQTPIYKLAATVDLHGAESAQNGFLCSSDTNQSLHNSLAEIAAGGALNLTWGSITGSQAIFGASNTLTIDDGGSLSLAGATISHWESTLRGAAVVLAGGTLHATSLIDATGAHESDIDDDISNGGLILVDGGQPGSIAPDAVFKGEIQNTGDISIKQDATAEFRLGLKGGTVTFGNNQIVSGAGVAGRETLKIDTATINPTATAAGVFTSTIAGFRFGDAIDLSAFANETGYSFDGASLVVNFAVGGTAKFALTGVGAFTTFSFASDGAGGTLIRTGVNARLAHDTGASATDRLTSNPALFGTGDAGATLNFTEKGNSLGATVVGANGVWSFAPTALLDGMHTIAVAEIGSGGAIPAASVVFELATKAPVVTGAGVSGPTNVTAETIAGVVTVENVAGEGAASVAIVNSLGTVVANAVLGANGAYSATVANLADGAYNFTVVATDLAGNIGRKALAEIDVATHAPTVVAQQNFAGLTRRVSYALTETATAEAVGANAIASVTVFDGTTALGAAKLSGGVWSFAKLLADGAHFFNTLTIDAAGNRTATALAEIDVATHAPTVVAQQNFAGLTRRVSYAVTETATAEAVGANAIASVTVFDGTTALGAAKLSGGIWSFAKLLADGAHFFSTLTIDAAGNRTTTALAEIDVATHAPTVVAQQSVSGFTTQRTVTLTETATAEAVGANAIKSVGVYDGTKALGAAKLTGGVWSFTTAQLAFGVHNLETVTTDTAGNVTHTALAPVDVEPPATGSALASVDTLKGGASASALLGAKGLGTIDDQPVIGADHDLFAAGQSLFSNANSFDSSMIDAAPALSLGSSETALFSAVGKTMSEAHSAIGFRFI